MATNHGAPSVFKGNKRSLPSKPCVACGRPMTWRKRWARNWAEVKFCSDACRKARGPGAGPRSDQANGATNHSARKERHP